MSISLDVFTTPLLHHRHHNRHPRFKKNLLRFRRRTPFVYIHASKNTAPSVTITTDNVFATTIVATREELFTRAAVSATKFNVKATVNIKNKENRDFQENVVRGLDVVAHLFGNHVTIELVSVDVDPKTKTGKRSKEGVIKDWFHKSGDIVSYKIEFLADTNFGVPGAILVSNKHQQEFFLDSITIEGFYCGPIHFPCNSWVQSQQDHPKKRNFFSNKPYLPEETPKGLKALREEELEDLRGHGTGERKLCDRIYDYDVYNDLGNPDKGIDYVRPTLGTGGIKYPRRCHTGRPPCVNDETCESRLEKPLKMYVPRDEQFEEPKIHTFSLGTYKGQLRHLKPMILACITPDNIDVTSFAEIDKQ
ncbi:unnamed protein product [Rhodiola kirilowii]